MKRLYNLWILLRLFYYVLKVKAVLELEYFSPCVTVPPPCIRTRPAQHDAACWGQNVSTYMQFELPLSVLQQLTVWDITVHRESDPIIWGLRKDPTFVGGDRWRVSQLVSYVQDKVGLLTVMVEVYEFQQEDVFMSHIEIQKGDQIKSTSDEIWFQVTDDCTTKHSLPIKAATGIPDKLHPSLHPVHESTDIHSEFTDFNEEVMPHGSIKDCSANKILTLIMLFILLCMATFMILGVTRKFCGKNGLKTNIKPTSDEAKMCELERLEDNRTNENMDQATCFNKLEKTPQELQRWETLQSQVDKIYNLLALIRDEQIRLEQSMRNDQQQLERQEKTMVGKEKLNCLLEIGKVNETNPERVDVNQPRQVCTLKLNDETEKSDEFWGLPVLEKIDNEIGDNHEVWGLTRLEHRK